MFHHQVHDYVKSYVGEGKAQKKFATDYLERRSRWKNSLKSGARYEDDLTVPASALSPGDGEFQEAGKKGKSKKLTKQTKSKQNISYLPGVPGPISSGNLLKVITVNRIISFCVLTDGRVFFFGNFK